MKYLYSASENMFYPFELKNEYMAAGKWPDMGVEVEDSVFNEFIQTPPAGKIRAGDNKGFPAWIDLPLPTHEEAVFEAEEKKHQLIDAANDHINSNQWPGKAAMGRLNDTDKAKYNAWLDYLDSIGAVDISAAPDLNWPTPPEM